MNDVKDTASGRGRAKVMFKMKKCQDQFDRNSSQRKYYSMKKNIDVQGLVEETK